MADVDDSTTAFDDDHWEIYVTFVDEKPAVILVDIGVSAIVPIEGMSALVWLWVDIQSPDEEGFPSEDEDIKLNDVEDALTDGAGTDGIRYVGRITSNGRREFYFYTNHPEDFAEIATRAMQLSPDFQFEIGNDEDEDWSQYSDVLYPSPEDFQQIHNQHVIDKLEQAGDVLTQPRPVDHFANFKSEQDREAFSVAASALGYETVSRPVRDSETEFSFAVGLLRVDAVDPETIDRVTFELFDLARQHDGEYEGWGSKVVTS